MGVSRRHAAIRRNEEQNLDLWDLGSSNGTYLNGQRLSAHRPYRLHDGDELRLGSMIIRVFFQSPTAEQPAPEQPVVTAPTKTTDEIPREVPKPEPAKLSDAFKPAESKPALEAAPKTSEIFQPAEPKPAPKEPAPTEAAKPKRLQGCFVSDAEVERIVYFWNSQQKEEPAPQLKIEEIATPAAAAGRGVYPKDPLLEAARELAQQHEHISTSFLQRRLHIGYPRAARIMEQLEEEMGQPIDDVEEGEGEE